MTLSWVRNLLSSVKRIALQKQQARFFTSKVKNNSKVIVMVVPDEQLRSGGILSIFSFYYETKKLFGDSVFIATYANGRILSKYDWFNNDVNLIQFNAILESKKNFDDIIIHIPEYYVEVFPESLNEKQLLKLKSIKNVHINIMNQNQELMLSPSSFSKIRTICNTLTVTTAHSSYTTFNLRQEYNASVHLLSAWFERDKITPIFFDNKKDIMIVSPDEHPMKHIILEKIKEELPHIEQIIVRNMRYEDFKQLELMAKWSISFGEGFDGYTIFPMLKGGIGFAVFNDTFFDSKYKTVTTFYESYEAMLSCIVNDINLLDDQKSYDAYNKSVRTLLNEEYNYNLYVKRVKDFYDKNYTFA